MVPEKEEVLRQLKIARKTKNLSYQDIVEGTEKNGAAVSLSSVKRVFAEDSRASEFRYDTTLQPIIRFVLGIDSDDNPRDMKEAIVDVAGLSAVVDYKGAMIQKLEAELERAHTLHRSEIERLAQAENRKLDFLRGELKTAREERNAKEKELRSYRFITVFALILLCVSLIVIISLLLIGFITSPAVSLTR